MGLLRAVIMAGGSGTRFWPLSRQRAPKQFLRLFGQRSMLQQAFDRLRGLVPTRDVRVITGQHHQELVAAQLPELDPDQIVAEPTGRDTAPCLALAAALMVEEDPDARMLVLAADHLIPSVERFQTAVKAALELVDRHPAALVTFGIPPTRPATAYGYVRRGEPVLESHGVPIVRVQSFHEKPSEATARTYLDSGEYYWNSGLFCWRAQTLLDELERHAPDIRSGVAKIAAAWNTPDREATLASEFPQLRKISIDYAVMEHSSDVYMVEAPFAWDDVGSWLALERVLEPDGDQNVGIGERLSLDTRKCTLVSSPGHLVATIGVEDLIVVGTSDVTLVARREDEQTVKQLLASLADHGQAAYL